MTSVDYLRIATWDFKTYTSLAAKIRKKYPEGWGSRHWLQYTGYSSAESSIFYGSGDQSDRKHYVVSCSGHKAHDFFEWLMDMGLDWQKTYCTRIDLQQTILHPDVNLRKVYKSCPRKTKQWIESNTETIYVGARASAVFTRLYQKIERAYLRLEHEFKGDRAKAIWYQCLAAATHQSILQSHFVTATRSLKMGKWIQIAFDLELEILSVSVNALPEEAASLLNGRMVWLVNTETALGRYLDDDDLRPLVMDAIDRLHDHMQNKL